MTSTAMRHGVRWRALAACMVAALVAGLILWQSRSTPGGWMAGLRPQATARAEGPAMPDAAASRADAAQATPAALDATREDALRRAAEERHLRGLLAEPDPRRRLVALYLLAQKSGDVVAWRRARAAIARLRAEAPDDPLIALAQQWICADRRDPCTAADREAWAQLEPDNAAAHLATLERLQGDPAGQDAMLRRMAAGTRYDSHMHAVALETATAFDDYQPPPLGPEERRVLRELGLDDGLAARRQFAAAHHAWAMPFPALGGIGPACRPPLPAGRARDCHAVLLRMSRASTLIERMVAFRALERLTRGTSEHAHWLAAARRQRWQSQQFASIISGPDYWADFLRHGEVEAIRRGLLRAGRPLDPPTGWRMPGL